MATHDYNIANQTGSDFRADLNNALLAIVSNNSNASSPSTTYAYQLWVDTANNVLKLRNSANNAWITTGISITADNSFTGNITGNSATATALATARTINGVSFDGTANISFNTDSVSEGSSNKYFTNERVDDQVNSLLTAGSGISLTYDDSAGTLTIANTNSADITSVVAGDGLTGGGTSGDVTLAVSVDDSSIEINSDTLSVKASGITNAMLAGSIANDKLAGSIANAKLANSTVTINSQAISLGGSHTFDSDDIGEGSSNLYFTNARARGSLSIGSEGSASGNGAIAYNSSTGVFTYTPPVISGLTGDTDDLSEGSSNLYYTDARANSAIDARVTNTFINNLSGVVADTATALATARSIALSGDVTASGVNFDGTGDITLSTTIAANSVALGTDTTGNYVATVAGTSNEIEVSGSGSETASITIGLPDDVTIAGNLTVNGTTTTVNSDTLSVTDPLIKLAKANSGADSLDIGFYGLYDTSGSQDLYAGLFRDASDSGKFKLFKDLQAEPTTTVNTSGTGYAVGTLVSNLEGAVTGNVTGNVSGSSGSTTGNAATATALETARAIALSGDVVGTANFDGTAGISISTTIQANSVALGTDTTGDYVSTITAGTGLTSTGATSGEGIAHSLSVDAAQTQITSVGTLTTLTVDDITIDGSTISDGGILTITAGDDFIVDAEGDISLDANGGDIRFKDNGTVIGQFTQDANNFVIKSAISDEDLIFKGNDGGSEIVALTLDMSNAGRATFNENVKLGSSGKIGIGITPVEMLDIQSASGDARIRLDAPASSDTEIKFFNDGTAQYTIGHDDATDNFVIGGANVDAPLVSVNKSGGATFGGDIALSTSSYPKITLNDETGVDRQYSIGTSNETFIIRNETGTTDVLAITNDNKVGIGVTSPDANLHISSAGGTELHLQEETSGQAAQLKLTNTQNSFVVGADGNPQIFFINTPDAQGSGIVMDTSHNVGIGTVSPNGKLTISNSGAGGFEFTPDTTAFSVANSNYLASYDRSASAYRDIVFDLGGAESQSVRFKAGGSVGIGTSNPDVPFHVEAGQNVLAKLEATHTDGNARMLFKPKDNNGWNIGANDSGSFTIFDVVGNTNSFVVETGAASNTLVIDSNSRVGIGTSSPSFALHVDASGSGVIAGFFNDTDTTSEEALLQVGGTLTDNYGVMFGAKPEADTPAVQDHAFIVKTNDSTGTDHTERFRISSDGKCGIGTTSPQKALDIAGASSSGGAVMRLSGTGEGSQGDVTGAIQFHNADTTDNTAGVFGIIRGIAGASGGEGSLQILTDMPSEGADASNITMHFNSNGNVGVGTSSPQESLHTTGNIRFGDSAPAELYTNSNELRFGVDRNNDNSASNITFYADNAEKVRIDKDGNMLVGATSQTFGEKLHVTNSGSSANTGMFVFSSTDDRAVVITKHAGSASSTSRAHFAFLNSSNTEVGSIKCTGSATAFNTSSDARLKHVTGSSRGLDVINNLNPVAYNWKADGKADEGLIAQEVEELVPNAVNQDEDGYYQMDYSKLVTHLVKGMQEQQEQIESLKSEIANFKEK